MKTQQAPAAWLVGAILLTVVQTACTWVSSTGAAGERSLNVDRLIADLTPDIESLYLAWHELDQIHKEIKSLERGYLLAPDDRQLGYIQKAALYIQDASVRIHHQWERLAVLNYIREEMLRDYLTLSVDGLRTAVDAVVYDDRFLTVYRTFITHPALVTELDRAQASIQSHLTLMNRIADNLSPLANARGTAVRL